MRSKAAMAVGGLLALMMLWAPGAQANSVTFASNTTWATANSSNVNIGNAQAVCLNAAAPNPCPSGATSYGYGGGGWGLNLASIPGAMWIWAPGINGSTLNAPLAQYFFSQTFNLAGTPTSGSISVGVDDLATVFVNGNLIGSVGSITNASQAGGSLGVLTTFDISPFLVSGSNTITVMGQNGAYYFGCSSPSPCTYQQHPAGVVFGGILNYTPNAAPVPEPGSLLLLATGLGGLALRRRLRNP